MVLLKLAMVQQNLSRRESACSQRFVNESIDFISYSAVFIGDSQSEASSATCHHRRFS